MCAWCMCVDGSTVHRYIGRYVRNTSTCHIFILKIYLLVMRCHVRVQCMRQPLSFSV